MIAVRSFNAPVRFLNRCLPCPPAQCLRNGAGFLAYGQRGRGQGRSLTVLAVAP